MKAKPQRIEKLKIKRQAYKTLAKSRNSEVRIYSPCKRTIKILGRYYFLPFPYVVFGKFSGANRDGAIGSWLYVGFTNQNLTKNSLGRPIWFPPLGNIVSGWYCCLDNDQWHYQQPYDDSFDELINKFWSNEFRNNPLPGLLDSFGGRFHAWEKLTIEDVLKKLQNNPMKILLSVFIGIVAKGDGCAY